MAPKLYWLLASPPSRAVVLCAKELGIELELVEVDLLNKEHLKPDFLKLNPQHTVPVLDDDGFVIWDSHAIMPYLVSKYKKGSSLYPEDIKKRAIVNQRLHFDSAVLFAIHIKIAMSLLFGGATTIAEESLAALTEAYGYLETFLNNRKYVADDELTIADLSIWTTITNSSAYLPVDEKKYPNLTRWLKLMDEKPYSELNRRGGEEIRAVLQSILSQK